MEIQYEATGSKQYETVQRSLCLIKEFGIKAEKYERLFMSTAFAIN
jgi:hypothetical protein